MSTADLPDRTAAALDEFLAACAAGNVDAVRSHLEQNAELALTRHRGTTGLHAAVGHPSVLRLLLEHGADPNARDEGDNALPLHFAAGGGPLEAVELLIEAGSDVQGAGDLHELDVIGWATVFAEARRDVVELLVAHGARHHVFSAIALGDRDLLRRVVEGDTAALARRLSRYEQEQSPLHYVIAPPDGLVGGHFRTGEHYRTLQLLIELGADLEARDAQGRTPLTVAMLRGDRQAMRALHEAGARLPHLSPADPATAPLPPAGAVHKIRPMLAVADMHATIAWYRAIGFELTGCHESEGKLHWAAMAMGEAEVMFVPSGGRLGASRSGPSLWIDTDRLDALYATLKQQQLAWAHAQLVGDEAPAPEIPFTVDLHTAFYGQREFGIRDPDGVELMFAQPLDTD